MVNIAMTPRQSLNKAYLKEKVTRSNIELFRKNLQEFLHSINEKESEEHVKNNVTNFLNDTIRPPHLINRLAFGLKQIWAQPLKYKCFYRG